VTLAVGEEGKGVTGRERVTGGERVTGRGNEPKLTGICQCDLFV
jgi:hypothetical protein